MDDADESFRTSSLGGVGDARSTDHVVTLARISARHCFCSAFMVSWYSDFCFSSIILVGISVCLFSEVSLVGHAKPMPVYIVERVLAEQTNLLGHIYVLVKWVDYPDSYNSWIQKNEMVGVEEGAGTGALKPGSGRVRQVDNFVSDSDVLAKLQGYRKMTAYNYANVIIDSYFYQALDIGESNYLLIWNYESHLYVLCIFNGQVFLADGVDEIHRPKKAQAMVRRYISRRFTLCRVGEQQLGIDHCGSSAVLIGLEMLRLMKGGVIDPQLVLPAQVKRRLVDEMHPFNSERLNGSPRIAELVKGLKCRYCVESYQRKGASRMKMHERRCTKREASSLT